MGTIFNDFVRLKSIFADQPCWQSLDLLLLKLFHLTASRTLHSCSCSVGGCVIYEMGKNNDRVCCSVIDFACMVERKGY